MAGSLRLPLFPFHFLLLLLALIYPSKAEIKTLEISSDSRQIILFEKFGFNHRGTVSISLSGVSFSSSSSAAAPAVDPSLLGFFLISDESLIQATYDSQQNPNPSSYPDCVLMSPYVHILFNFIHLSPPPPAGAFNGSFSVTQPDEYSLYFANCASGAAAVSMSVHTEMYNARSDGSPDYLSMGLSPVPSLYTFFAVAYAVFLVVWIYLTLFQNRLSTHRIHHLMSGLLLTKALYLVFAAEDQHYIRQTGTPHGWDVPFYLFQFLKGVLLFTVIVLIGTGWSFLKPFLQEREKKVLMIVIPLQIIANIASVVIGETGPFIRDWVTWNQISAGDIKDRWEGCEEPQEAHTFPTVLHHCNWISVLHEDCCVCTEDDSIVQVSLERNQYFVLDEEEEEAAELALREEEFEL
ncbi:hypothetical protein OPV22_010488 [Ensete ventricosum]|uniref:Intimal thickness related receptor IRP domain-containing protein n=1 Tax=Ensete ventricosum TaxID=4639 RepID=A0AAV8RBE8_ENSVE|nr:hypothetical protein OPV22_010488 [Ensete ventricosum]